MNSIDVTRLTYREKTEERCPYRIRKCCGDVDHCDFRSGVCILEVQDECGIWNEIKSEEA